MKHTWAHPRAGGENDVSDDGEVGRRGSSPRGRGKHHQEAVNANQDRLIPARAGKTRVFRVTVIVLSAHPRAGGENLSFGGLVPPDAGSSPRGRGKPFGMSRRSTSGGLIPARAGKTSTLISIAVRIWAHPRAGGENFKGMGQSIAQEGSSPRGRGKHDAATDFIRWTRLIPARAGKTSSPSTPPRAPAAHPRAGGENTSSSTLHQQPNGSSPRGRGKPGDTPKPTLQGRLIPARAGKTELTC